jgi:hypothetical protein
MGIQDITHNPNVYISLGIAAVVALVLLGLVIVGIVIAVRAKTGTGKGCGIIMAVAFALQLCAAAFWFVISLLAHLDSSSTSGTQVTQTIPARDGSCQISVPQSWVNSPELSDEAVLGAKNLAKDEYVIVFVDSKQDYTGTLADFAQDHTDLLRRNLKTPQVEAAATITINGRSAIRQVVHGEIKNRVRIAYVITYFEGANHFYQVLCWSLESKAGTFRDEFDKIAGTFAEKESKQ